MRLRRGVLFFGLVGLLVLSLVRAGEVQLVTVALIVALAVALHRAGPQRV
ncbi:MAG: hypothetical protein ABI717_02970 [Actinomycetota bacterium]